MKHKRKRSMLALGAGTAAMLTLTLWTARLRAADHMEAPGTRADQAADIADVYAWHDSANNKLTTIITFAGLAAPAEGQTGAYDASVLYTLSIDNNGDSVSDIDVLARFGQNRAGEWGVQVQNLPGAGGTISGAVNTVLSRGSARAFAGFFDDPFFFDLDGFNMTRDGGALAFDNTRDSFAVSNCTALVFEMDLTAARNGGTSLNIWGATARKGGN